MALWWFLKSIIRLWRAVKNVKCFEQILRKFIMEGGAECGCLAPQRYWHRARMSGTERAGGTAAWNGGLCFYTSHLDALSTPAASFPYNFALCCLLP